MRDRTADLLDANQALSQLSYGPIYRTEVGTLRGRHIDQVVICRQRSFRVLNW